MKLASLAADSCRLAALGPADLVLHGGNVVPVAQRQTRAQRFAVIGKRIAAIASDVAIKPRIDLRAKTIDLRGISVLPGFIACHAHFPFGRFPGAGNAKK